MAQPNQRRSLLLTDTEGKQFWAAVLFRRLKNGTVKIYEYRLDCRRSSLAELAVKSALSWEEFMAELNRAIYTPLAEDNGEMF
jgi:hypothetical protein